MGRFAARRLADKVVVDSIARSEDDSGRLEHVWAEFDWSRFQPGLSIEDVKIPVGREFLSRQDSEAYPTGLTLVLSGVKDIWTEIDVRSLSTDLLRLVSPAPRTDGGDFAIVMEAPEFPAFTGDLADRFLDYGLGRLRNLASSVWMVVRHTSLKFRDDKKKRFAPKSTEFLGVGPASFDIAFFVYKSTFFAGLPIKTRDAQGTRPGVKGASGSTMDRFPGAALRRPW